MVGSMVNPQRRSSEKPSLLPVSRFWEEAKAGKQSQKKKSAFPWMPWRDTEKKTLDLGPGGGVG